MKYLLLSLLLLPLCGIAQTNPALDALTADPSLRHANWSVLLQDVESGTARLTRAADRSLPPASTMKVVTTATALAVLGPDHRFETELGYAGQIADGVLYGDLYLKGYGDPTLASPETAGVDRLPELLARLVAAVRNAGITRIEGGVIADASYLRAAPTPPDWQWKDIGNYYGAGAYGLNFHDNQYTLYFEQSAQGTPPRILRTDPPVPGLSFHNEVISAGRGDNSYIYNAEGSLQATVRGTITPGSGTFDIDGSLPDPPLLAAQCLLQALEDAAIKVVGNARTTRVQGTTLLTLQSPPLRDIVYRTNLASVNLYAETLVLHLGRTRNTGDDRRAGLSVIRDTWRARGVDMDGAFLTDGSGLSATNGLTARQLVGILSAAARDPRIAAPLYDSLPVAGLSGSMRTLLRDSPLAGNLRAKTGVIANTRTFAGYVHTPEGELRAFAVLVNRFAGSGGALRRRLEPLFNTFGVE